MPHLSGALSFHFQTSVSLPYEPMGRVGGHRDHYKMEAACFLQPWPLLDSMAKRKNGFFLHFGCITMPEPQPSEEGGLPLRLDGGKEKLSTPNPHMPCTGQLLLVGSSHCGDIYMLTLKCCLGTFVSEICII